MRDKEPDINNEAFVVVWMAVVKRGGNLGDIAEAFKISKYQATIKGTYLRRIGVELPRFKSSKPDIDYLNSLLKEEE